MQDNLKQFQQYWDEFSKRCAFPVVHSVIIFRQLLKAYSEPQRHYHSVQHIVECLKHLDEVRHLLQDAQGVELALWFHDAVFDVRAADNEEKSAAWATQSLALLDVSSDNIDIVRHLILSTKPSYARTDSFLEDWMHDIDLHIFGVHVPKFAQFTQDIRQEFAWVDDLNYRRGHDLVMRRLITNPHGIYRTEAGRLDYEETARTNIELQLQGLSNLQLVLEVPNGPHL